MTKRLRDQQSSLKRILLVEDEALIALDEKQTMEQHGFEVLTAHSGQTAVDAACNGGRIDLILMDVDLGPGMDGTQAAEQILERRRVPIVFLTSHTEKEYVERVKRITSYGYVVKHSGEFVLIESINMALQLFEAHEAVLAKEREETRRFRELFEQATVGIIIADQQHNLIDINPYALEILGYSKEEALRLNAEELTHPDDFAALPPEENLDHLKRSNRPRQMERRYRRKDGSYAHTLVSMRRLRSIEPQASHVLMFHDISDRRRTEEKLRYSEEQYRKLVENSPDLVLEIGPDNTYTYASPNVERITGYSADDFVGHHVFEKIHPDIQEQAFESLSASIADGAVRELEIPIMHANGSWHVHWVRGVPFFDENGTYTGAMAIVREVTERKQSGRPRRRSGPPPSGYP